MKNSLWIAAGCLCASTSFAQPFLEIYDGWNIAKTGCQVRSSKSMSAEYSGSMLTLTRKVLVGLDHSMGNRGLSDTIARSRAGVRESRDWLARFLDSYVRSESSRAVALQLNLDTRQAWVILETDSSGSMGSLTIGPTVFDAVVAVLDLYLCASRRLPQQIQGNLPLEQHFRELQEAKTNPWIALDSTIIAELAFYKRIGTADRASLSGFQEAAPNEYQEALLSRALFVSAAKETIDVWRKPSQAAETLSLLKIEPTNLQAIDLSARNEFSEIFGSANAKTPIDFAALLKRSSPTTDALIRNIATEVQAKTKSPWMTGSNTVYRALMSQEAENPLLKFGPLEAGGRTPPGNPFLPPAKGRSG